MKKLYWLLTILFCASFLQAQQTTFLLEENFKDYIPISAIEYEAPVVIAYAPGSFDTLTVRELSTSRLKVDKFLTDQSVNVTIEKINSNGGISYAGSSASVKKGSYTVTVDFVKFNTIDMIQNDGSCGGFAKVGVGLRIRANVITKRSGINIGNLFGLAIAAEKGKLSGTLSFDVIGIDSKEVTTLLPIPSEISQSSIQNALQAMATIKSKLYDSTTQLHPKIIAIKLTDGCGVDGLIVKMKEEAKVKIKLQQQQQKEQKGKGKG